MGKEPLPRELQDLIDREQVVALMNQYFATIDERGSIDDEWARSLFTEDVRVVHRGFTLEGIEAIAAGHRFVVEGWDRTLHLASNARVEVDGDRAHLTGRLIAIHVHRDEQPPEPYIIANVFDADAVRTVRGWRFQGLNQQTVWSSGRSHLDLGRSES